MILGHYTLCLIFEVLALMSTTYDNTVVLKVTAEITGCKQNSLAWLSNTSFQGINKG